MGKYTYSAVVKVEPDVQKLQVVRVGFMSSERLHDTGRFFEAISFGLSIFYCLRLLGVMITSLLNRFFFLILWRRTV